MTDAEVRRYSDALQRTHRVVYGLAGRGDRSSGAYRAAVAELSAAVSYASELLAEQPEAAGRSRGRSSERPPYGVSVDVWREFVAQFNAARTTWFNETGSGAAVTSAGGLIQPAGGSSMPMTQSSVTNFTTDVQRAKALVEGLADGVSLLPSALRSLRSATDGAMFQVNQHVRAVGGTPVGDASQATRLGSHVPPGVTTASWTTLLDMIRRADYTHRSRTQSAAARTGAPTTAQPAAAGPVAPSATQPGPDAPAARRPRQRRQQQPRSSGGGERPLLEQTIPEAAASVAEGTMEAARTAFDTARGTFDALSTVGTILRTTPGAVIEGSPIRAPLTLIDRLLLIATVLNPPSVPVTQRPWFWPAILGTTAYLGYYYYTKHQRESAAKKKAAPAKPAAALPAAPRGA
jgi:hypothetical protein